MSEYLTPEEVELWARGSSEFIAGDTLRAYAKVVEAVANPSLSRIEQYPRYPYDDVGECFFCQHYQFPEDGPENEHGPDCIYLLARELRGHAEQG